MPATAGTPDEPSPGGTERSVRRTIQLCPLHSARASLARTPSAPHAHCRGRAVARREDQPRRRRVVLRSVRIWSAMRPEFCADRRSRCARGDLPGCRFRNSLAFSRPWPRRWLSKENQAPDFSTMPALDAEIDQLADLGDALAVHDVELDLLERRRDLVLDDLDAGLVADHLVALLDRADAADVEADGGVELQRVAAGGRLRASRTSRRSSCGSG